MPRISGPIHILLGKINNTVCVSGIPFIERWVTEYYLSVWFNINKMASKLFALSQNENKLFTA